MIKRTCVIIIISTCLSVSAFAQRKVLENWDTSRGVTVYVPPPPPVTEKKGKKFVRKTGARRSTSAADGYAVRTGPVTRLVMGSGTDLKSFTTGNPTYDAYIVESSRKYRIDPLLIYAQMHQESSFKLRARSHKGASGLMQLMPATARRFGVTKIWDPKQNIDAGVKYMRWLPDTFNGDVALALAGYNAGEGAVMKYGWNIPPYRETQEYVRRISARYNTISDPRYVETTRRANLELAANLQQKESRPLTVLEPAPLTVALANGQMMLVNQ